MSSADPDAARAASFVIGRARPEMAPVLTTIAREAKASWGYPRGWLDSWRTGLTLSAEYIALHSVFIATSSHAAGELDVLGVVALEERTDHYSLEHVWVRPAAQGRGIGRRLVEHALMKAWSVAPWSTVRVESDPNAAGFYARLGARRIGSVPAPVPGDRGRALPLFEFTPPTV